jgi:Domain of unknown function (DUF4136)
MSFSLNRLRWCLLLTTIAIPNAFAQKVSVGYDKSADFSKYASYTWAEPERTPSRPLLYASIVGSIDQELKAKGLTRTDSGGDLILIPAGGIEFGLASVAGTPIMSTYGGVPPAIDATMWSGAGGAGQLSSLTAPSVPEGTLVLNFVDRRANKVIWTGTTRQKLEMENKKKSLDLVDRAIAKLLKKFPPQKK